MSYSIFPSRYVVYFGLVELFHYFTLDSALSLNSEQFGIGTNGKSDNIKMAVLGPYKVSNVEKMDTGKYSTKTKLGKEISYSSDDGSKFKVRKFESHAFTGWTWVEIADTASCFSPIYQVRTKNQKPY